MMTKEVVKMKNAKNVIALDVDLTTLKKQYRAHTSRCQQIAKEVNKWGQKTSRKLQFLQSAK